MSDAQLVVRMAVHWVVMSAAPEGWMVGGRVG
jgi:hypothetical protein